MTYLSEYEKKEEAEKVISGKVIKLSDIDALVEKDSFKDDVKKLIEQKRLVVYDAEKLTN